MDDKVDDKADEERRREATRGRRHEATRAGLARSQEHRVGISQRKGLVGMKPQGDVMMKSLSLGAP